MRVTTRLVALVSVGLVTGFGPTDAPVWVIAEANGDTQPFVGLGSIHVSDCPPCPEQSETGCRCVRKGIGGCSPDMEPGGGGGLCIWVSREDCQDESRCHVTFEEYYACVDMQTGAACWPEYDVCSEPSASPDNECWCDLYWESPCPCNCSGLATDACRKAACIDDACVVVPIDCDDGNECTQDSCDPCACPNGCENIPLTGTSCDDDGNECTDDVCDDGSCTHPPEEDGTPCVDDNECTEDDTCQGGFCTSGPPVADGADCDDDGNECTDDECQGGSCTHPDKPDGIGCDDDGNECTNDECQGGSCTHPDKSNGTSCDDDGNECTDDECVDGTCTHPPEEDCTPCDQGLGWCVNEVCEPVECSLVAIEDVTACSGQQVQSPVMIGACQPYCVEDDQVILEGVGLPEGWTLTGSADCATDAADGHGHHPRRRRGRPVRPAGPRLARPDRLRQRDPDRQRRIDCGLGRGLGQ